MINLQTADKGHLLKYFDIAFRNSLTQNEIMILRSWAKAEPI